MKRRKALVVGINDYPNIPLHGCVNDANAISTIIETDGDGSPNFEVNLMINVKTKAELLSNIVDLFTGDSDISLLYFSGHGAKVEYGGYLVTPDYKEYDLGVSMNEVLSIANKSKAKNRIIILDCCSSGTFGLPEGFETQMTGITEGVTILTASKASEAAFEVNGHGVFTNLLIDALQGGATDIMGNITPGSIYAYIDQALGEWEQRPVFRTNINKFASIRNVVPLIQASVLRNICGYFPVASDEFQLDPSYEETNKTEVQHEVVEPYATEENVVVFKELQKMQSVGLIKPVDEDYMYFAAMKSKTCKLTALGYHYWRLVDRKRI